MKRLLKLFREPWVLCILIGPLLYILYARTSAYVEHVNKRIYVSQAQIASLEETFTRTWNRPPGPEELEDQVNGYVMDEIFYKEAVAMGLDKTDLTVKRRLRQIMEMMMDEYATIFPNEEQLRTFLAENPEKFRRDDRMSFSQLYFPPEENEEAARFLSRLRADESAIGEYTGGLIMIPVRQENQTGSEISSRFGVEFAGELAGIETGRWEGPLASPYGWHLVWVRERIEGEIPELNEIWDQVEREWSVERKIAIKEEQYALMREQYHITIEN